VPQGPILEGFSGMCASAQFGPSLVAELAAATGDVPGEVRSLCGGVHAMRGRLLVPCDLRVGVVSCCCVRTPLSLILYAQTFLTVWQPYSRGRP
jgi:hypothetical protein